MTEKRKAPNIDIRLSYQGTQALAEADIPFPVAMKVYDVVEGLSGKFSATEQERIKLIKKHGEEAAGGWTVPHGTAAWDAFQAEWLELLSTEQEIPDLPVIFVSELGDTEAVKKIGAKASELGALRRIGVLAHDPPPATRPERRRAEKAQRKAGGPRALK